MVELIDLTTVNINGVFAGTYDEAYRNNPDYHNELWIALVEYDRQLVAANKDLTMQLNECRSQLE